MGAEIRRSAFVRDKLPEVENGMQRDSIWTAVVGTGSYIPERLVANSDFLGQRILQPRRYEARGHDAGDRSQVRDDHGYRGATIRFR